MTTKNDRNKIFTTNGCSNHSEHERQAEDYYATDPEAFKLFYKQFYEDGETINKIVWETCVGGGHLAQELTNKGHAVICSDIIDRGYPNTKILDFLKYDPTLNKVTLDIVTNPPYKYAQEFAEHSLKVIPKGSQLIMFLKITFLEGVKRKQFFKDNPPKYVYVHSNRFDCALNGDFEARKGVSSAVCYAWFVWENGFKGEPIIRWLYKDNKKKKEDDYGENNIQ